MSIEEGRRIPLAERMRPSSLDEIVGQSELLEEGGILKEMLLSGQLSSFVLWGPPGVGKTTIARTVASSTNSKWISFSAVVSGIKEIKNVMAEADAFMKIEKRQTVLFVDEIHRFNKGQQDALLGAVEKGIVTLIGATTENPSFEVNSALLSRCQVYILKPLTNEALVHLIQHAIKRDVQLKSKKITLKETSALINISGGDARKLLNLLELVCDTSENEVIITDSFVMDIAQKKIALYDKKGEQHYDIISAFIKSIRGSDPNAAVYWLARMIEGGEDVKFIARRLVILASEDIGNANPTALVMANASFEAVNKIGYPESNLILSQCTIYLASSPKSNSATIAIGEALAAVKKHGDLSVPLHIRNAPTRLMKNMGYGKDYQYSHNYKDNFSEQEYLPEEISGTKFYTPGENAREEELRKFLKNLWKEKYKY